MPGTPTRKSFHFFLVLDTGIKRCRNPSSAIDKRLSRALGYFVAHQNAKFVELLPLTIQRQEMIQFQSSLWRCQTYEPNQPNRGDSE